MLSKDSSRSQKVAKLVTELCHEERLTMYSLEGKRKSDVIGFCVWGDRKKVLQIPARLLELLKHEDMEIWQSGRRGLDYVLVFIVTEKLMRQALVRPERRAKLLMRKNRYLPGINAEYGRNSRAPL